MTAMTVRILFQGLLVLAVLLLVTYLLKDVLDQQWVDAQIRGHGIYGELLFVLLCTLLGSVGLSRQLIAFLGGYAFGVDYGFLLSMLAVVSACITTFYVSRWFLRSFMWRHFSDRIRRVDAFIRDNTFMMALLIRLLPLGSNWMVNIGAGVSGVRSVPFFTGSALGYVPQMLIFSLLGSGVRVDEFWQLVLAMVLFVVAAVIGGHLYRQYRQDSSLPRSTDNEAEV
jgi:uncharacterized membrane protein YdjX (TVP38/TMEM64 family)